MPASADITVTMDDKTATVIRMSVAGQGIGKITAQTGLNPAQVRRIRDRFTIQVFDQQTRRRAAADTTGTAV